MTDKQIMEPLYKRFGGISKCSSEAEPKSTDPHDAERFSSSFFAMYHTNRPEEKEKDMVDIDVVSLYVVVFLMIFWQLN